jgi:hypothetical protein
MGYFKVFVGEAEGLRWSKRIGVKERRVSKNKRIFLASIVYHLKGQ